MINRFIYSFLLLGCMAWALAGCTADPDVEGAMPIGGDGSASWITIDFSDQSFEKVDIKTRATLDNIAESRVSNLFVFIFGETTTDGDAPRVYGRFFDHTNRKDTRGQFDDAKKDREECWIVQDNAAAEMPHGKVHIMAPAISNGTLYIIANVNADMVNISPDKLRFVEKLSDLKNMTATLNQEITERNGFFPMTGLAGDDTGNITIGSSKILCNGSEDFEVKLGRLDAKIEVKVRVAKGYKGSTTNTVEQGETSSGGGGSKIDVTTTHEIDSFIPLSWQVVNLPRTAFVLPHTNDAPTVMFATRETKFETREKDNVTYYDDNLAKNTTVETEAHGFSFYMLENRAAAKVPVPITAPDPDNPNDQDRLYDAWGYHARDTRLKDQESGAYTADPDETSDIWKYAPAEGTYLVIKGEVVMALDISNEGKNQQLSADVVYYIHLGDFGGKDTNGDGKIDQHGDIDNYDILRNTSYTYTVTIFGVDNIQIEVEKKRQENQSGATGHVYVAKETILTLDSHFGSAVVSFDEAHITNVENLLWYVKTPFGREGKPHVIGGIEVPAGLDYQWVHFMVNDRDKDDKYIKTHMQYHPEKLMNILEFSKYIKDQKRKYLEDKKDGIIGTDSDFRPELDSAWMNKFEDDPSVWTRYRIYVTVFVDEFYYDANPITGDVRQDLWKDFVNQPNRLMHILCDSDDSADEASRTTGSVLTIRQRSIQTVYNPENSDLKEAWGCETIDETRDVLWYYSRKEKYDENGYWVEPPDMRVDNAIYDSDFSNDNGLYNTGKIWGLFTDADKIYTPKLWEDYVDHDRRYALKDIDTIETLRYSCMTRNRDENGNGNIDAKEVKWYMASINQLSTLYIGDQGLSTDAILYPYYKQQITSPDIDDTNNTYPWRAHIVSSTRTTVDKDNSDKVYHCPKILWAEEGLSTGGYVNTWRKSAPLSVRCVRNLGMEPTDERDAQTKLMNNMHYPKNAIHVELIKKDDGQSVYRFDMTSLNPQSIRYFSSQELEPRNEHSVEARTYWGFETGILTTQAYIYDDLYDLIRNGKSPCPEGYRVPNVREGALMSMYCAGWWQKDTYSYVLTYYSHGLRGSNQDLGANNDGGENGRSDSWLFQPGSVILDKNDNSTNVVRCIKDIRQ